MLSAHRVSSNIYPFHVCLLSNKPVVLSGWLKILFSILILRHYLTWLLTGNFVVSDTTSINYRTRGIENMILLLKECWLLDEVYCQKAILKRTSSKNGFPTTNLWPTKAGNMKFREVSLISKLTSRKYENPEWPATSCLFYDLRGYIAINCAPEHMLD